MILTFISWVWISISAFLTGFLVSALTERVVGFKLKSLDELIISGLCLLTVYSQIFSLFYKVGAVATVILILICMVTFAVFRQQIFLYFFQIIKQPYFKTTLLLLLIIGSIFATIGSGQNFHYDTELYHAQSVEWIENYGIVKGLGNLHNRLAYNSSIFCLQALFSLKFAVNQSLHTLNGYISFLFTAYAVLSLKCFRRSHLYLSDLFKICTIIYFSFGLYSITSVSSDIFVLGLFLYILSKWSLLNEESINNPSPYALLCVLGVFASSVKLSVVFIALLAIKPAICLLKEKKIRDITFYIVLGFMVFIPFIIRNVIISGYLIYPYAAIDLFNFDWKMPRSVVVFDSNEIMSWGRALNDVNKFDWPLKEWFPVWYRSIATNSKIYITLFWINAFLVFFVILDSIYLLYHKKKYDRVLLYLVSVSNLLLWFFTAPLIRYGFIYLLLLPCIFIGVLAEIRKMRWICSIAACASILIFISRSYYWVELNGLPSLKRPVDYSCYECVANKFENSIIYTPSSGDQSGYHYFPATPYVKRLGLIEMRGESYKEGFRTKKEYINKTLTTYGDVFP